MVRPRSAETLVAARAWRAACTVCQIRFVLGDPKRAAAGEGGSYSKQNSRVKEPAWQEKGMAMARDEAR
ncbi:hypothetical protein JCM14713_14310 [Desulfomicrobium salsuginis]